MMRVLCSLLVIALFPVSVSTAGQETGAVVRGIVVGHDGKPMRAALAVLLTPGAASQKQFVDQVGRFTFPVKAPGSYTLVLTGVHHKTLFVPVFVEDARPVGLTVRLAASEYRATMSDVRLVGDFNRFSTKSGGIPMRLQPDATFVATVAWKGDALSYAIQGVLDGTDIICGTQADSFAQETDRPFVNGADNQLVSVVRSNGQPVTIVFDPRQLPRGTTVPDVRFDGPSSRAARIYEIDRTLKIEGQRVNAARQAYVSTGGDPAAFKPDSGDLLRQLERSIQEERDPLLLGYLLLRYFQLPEASTNVEFARRVFSDVPPDSLVWSLLRGGPDNTFFALASVAHAPSEDAYVSAAYESNPDRETRAAFLSIALRKAFGAGDANTVGRLYTRLMGDYGDTAYARRARSMAPNRNVQAGRPVPAFTWVSLDDAGDIVTPKSLEGRVFLIDFWATWCGPCVAEMPYLQTAYERFTDKGLVIVSVSLDDEADDIATFRRTKWKMPWFNVHLPGFDHEAVKAFEVVGVPKPVLVGPDGRIIATEGALRGDELVKTLDKVFAQK